MIIEIVIGVILILFFICLQYSTLKCNKKIEERYLRFNIYERRRIIYRYTPVFKYNFNGNEYESQALQSFTKNFAKNFVGGQKYTILVNEKNPKNL